MLNDKVTAISGWTDLQELQTTLAMAARPAEIGGRELRSGASATAPGLVRRTG